MTEICRTCTLKRASVDIYSCDKFVYAKLITCVRFSISHNDGFPSHICENCLKKLEEAFNFIKQCEDSNKYFQDQLEENEPLKTEMSIETFHNSESNDTKLKSEEILGNIGKNLPDIIVKTKKKVCLKDDTDLYEPEIEAVELLEDIDERLPMVKSKTNKIKLKKCKRKSLEDRNSYKCEKCDQVFKLKSVLKEHLKTHEDIKKGITYKCNHCKQCFRNNPTSYKEHIDTKVCREKFTCSKCEKILYSKYHYELHVNRCHLEKIPCEHCGKIFENRHSLRKHIKLVHDIDPNAFCKICNKTFNNHTRYQNHWRLKHKTKELVKCDLCDFTSRHKQSLKSHLRAHLNIRPYKCQYCDKAFTVRRSLTEHERLHTGVTPYVCPICGLAFVQKGNMKSHFRHNHKDAAYVEPKKDIDANMSQILNR